MRKKFQFRLKPLVNTGLENLEYPVPQPVRKTRTILVEGNHDGHAGLCQSRRHERHPQPLQRPQFFRQDGFDDFRGHGRGKRFELLEAPAEFHRQTAVAGQNLPKLVQRWAVRASSVSRSEAVAVGGSEACWARIAACCRTGSLPRNSTKAARTGPHVAGVLAREHRSQHAFSDQRFPRQHD